MLHATKYVQASELQRRDVNDIIEEYKDYISKINGRCIDIGCGPGTVTKELLLPSLGSKATVVCTDISESMINYAKEEYKDEERLSFGVLDIQTPNLPDEHISQYEHIFSFYCLNWCVEMRQVFENMYNLLLPGGKSLVLFMASNNMFNAWYSLSAYPKYHSYMKDVNDHICPTHYYTDREGGIRKILMEVGFKVDHCSIREKMFRFQSFDAMKNAYTCVDPFVKRIPDHLKKGYAEDFMKEMLKYDAAIPDYLTSNNNTEKEIELVANRYYVSVIYMEKPQGK